jgi:late competence protein required for DNA uptake (superfamily II DNA/RNA helicase)
MKKFWTALLLIATTLALPAGCSDPPAAAPGRSARPIQRQIACPVCGQTASLQSIEANVLIYDCPDHCLVIGRLTGVVIATRTKQKESSK